MIAAVFDGFGALFRLAVAVRVDLVVADRSYDDHHGFHYRGYHRRSYRLALPSS